MKIFFNLSFSICDISLCFENFEEEYINFFVKIYAHYLESEPNRSEGKYNIVLRKYGNTFAISPNPTLKNMQDIKDLYNIIHYVICDAFCTSCNEQNLIVLHASTFMLNGKLVILAGVKSSGKTTALLYFLKNGAIYTGDEIVIISSNGVQPYLLPLRAKKNTIKYLHEKYNYEFDFYQLPSGIDSKKQYLSNNNSFCMKKINSWVECDYIIFMNEDESKYSLQTIPTYDSLNYLLRCIRNKTSISVGLSLIKGVKQYSTDFSVPLDEVKNIICE